MENIDTVNQAVDFIINKLDDNYKDYIASLKPIDLKYSALHFGLGMFIRNNIIRNSSEAFKKAYNEYNIYGISSGEIGEGRLIDAVWRKLKGINVDDKIIELDYKILKLLNKSDKDITFENTEYLNLLAQKLSLLIQIPIDKAIDYMILQNKESKIFVLNPEILKQEFQRIIKEIRKKQNHILALLTEDEIEIAEELELKKEEFKRLIKNNPNDKSLIEEKNKLYNKWKNLLFTQNKFL